MVPAEYYVAAGVNFAAQARFLSVEPTLSQNFRLHLPEAIRSRFATIYRTLVLIWIVSSHHLECISRPLLDLKFALPAAAGRGTSWRDG